MLKRGYIAIAALALFGAAACSKKAVLKRPKLGSVTEFHRKPSKVIMQFYASHNTRGSDFNPGTKSRHVSRFNQIGGGLGAFINTSMGQQWIGHKLFYYYIDLEISPEYSGDPYPGKKHWVFSSYPGL